MATLATNVQTLADHAKMLDPDGKVDMIVDTITERNDILEDMVWKEGNLPTGELTTVLTGLPSVAWRMLNYGYQPSKMTTKQVTDTCGMLGTFGEVDKDIANLNGNTAEYRMKQDAKRLKALGQEFASTFFYGNTDTAPEEFLGLTPRYSSKSADNGANILLGGGSGADNTSLWLLTFGEEEGGYGIFPKGSKAGIEATDLGEQVLIDAAGGKYLGFQNHYQWKCGYTMKNWKYNVRIPNIDVSDLTYNGATGAKLIDLMVQAIHRNEDVAAGKTAFYCNRTILSFLDRQTLNQSNMNVTYKEGPHGERVTMFRGIPVRRCDALVENESLVS